MSDNVESIILEYMHKFDKKLDRFGDDLSDIKFGKIQLNGVLPLCKTHWRITL